MEMLHAMLASFILSMLLGMERQISKKPVGFAPYVLVTTMSTALSFVAMQIFPSNPSFIISGIITGIGFLGAGALIKYHEKVFGFTTASMVWSMAVFGVLVAVADIGVVAISYLAIWVVICIDHVVEMKGFGRHMRSVRVEASTIGSHSGIKSVISSYQDSKEQGLEINFDRNIVEYKFFISTLVDMEEMVKKFSALKSIKKIEIS